MPGLADRLGVDEVQVDAPDVGLVGDRVAEQLDHDRVADRLAGFDRFLDRRGDASLRDGDAVAGQDSLRLDLRQQRPALGADGFDDRRRVRPVDGALGIVGDDRGLVQGVQIVRGAPQVVEHLDSRVRVGKGRDTGSAEDGGAFRHVLAAHPGGEDRFAGDVREGDQGLGRQGRIGHRLGREDHQHPVRRRIRGGDCEGLGVSIGWRIADDVHRVVVAPGRRQDLVIRGPGGLRQFGQAAAAAHQGVRREHRRPPRVGHDGQGRPTRPGLLVEHLGHPEEVGDAVHAQDAHAPEGSVQYLVRTGEGARVRCRRLGRLGGAAGLDDDDRLGQRDLTSGGQEGPRVADRLHVDEDALGARIVPEIGDDVSPTDVEHGPERHDRTETDPFTQAPVQDGRQEGAALTDEADGTARCHPGREGRVQATDRVHHAEAVGPDHADARRACLGEDPALQFGAFRSDLSEPGRDDDHAPDTLGRALSDQAWRGRCGRDDDGKVDRVGDRREARVGLDPEDAGTPRVDGVDRAPERAADQVPQHVAADAASFLRGADDGHGARPEDRLEWVMSGPQHVGRGVGRAVRRARTVGGDGHDRWSLAWSARWRSQHSLRGRGAHGRGYA